MRRARLALLRLAVLVTAVSVFLLASSAVAHYAFGAFDNYGEALWSGLQHLLDPGALENDEGAGERIIGVIQLLAGLVFIVGVLIAVMEETISGSLRRITEGDPRVHASGHVVIAGWNPLAPELIGELAAGVRIGGPRDVAVLLPARLGDERIEIAEELEARGRGLRLRVLSGDPGPAAFGRASVRTAATVYVISGAEDPQHADAADVETITACLTLRGYLGDAARPAVRPVLRRGLNADAVAERFPASWDFVVADRALGGLTGLAASQPELVAMITQPFGPGPERGFVYAVEAPDLVGTRFADLAAAFAEGLPVGVAPAGDEVTLVPDPELRLCEDDRVVLLAATRTAAIARRAPDAAGAWRGKPGDLSVREPLREPRRVVATGSPASVRTLLEDLAERSPKRYSLTVLHPQGEDVALGAIPDNVTVQRLRGRPSEPDDLGRAIEQAEPDVLIAYADPGDGEAADSRALLTALHADRLGPDSLRIVADLFSRVEEGIGSRDDRIFLLSRSAVLARWLTLLIADPVSARATEALLSGAGYRLDLTVCEPAGGHTIDFAAAYKGLLPKGMLPIGIAHEDAPASLNPPPDAPVGPAAELIVIRRARPPADAS